MTRIVFVGAGSVVFTRQLLADLLRYDDLPELDLRCSTSTSVASPSPRPPPAR